MYAIIQTGGKQYRIQKGDVIDVELLEVDSQVEFSNILVLGDEKSTLVGTPFVEKCLVKGEILGEVKGPKVIAYKYKKRKNSRRKVGHRQRYSRVKIVDIVKGEK